MQSAKETASNIAASAKSGMEKTKAVAQEKVEKMTTRDPLKKEMAEQKKDARINETERMKNEARAENAAARREHGHPHARAHAHDYTATGNTTGTTDLPAGAGYTAEGPVGGDHPAAATRASGRTGILGPRVTGRNNTGYGSGETY